eukprot:jgi/Chrzof1/14279/Cz08g31310.t1
MPNARLDTVASKIGQFLRDVGDVSDISGVLRPMVDRRVLTLECDDAFSSQAFQNKMRQDYDIMVQTIVAKAEHVTEGDPLGIIDNACGYLKRLIDRHVDATGDKRWPNFLGSILEAFNEHQNSDMDYMTPNEVYNDMPHMLDKWQNEVQYNRALVADLPIKVGDRVHVIVAKGTFKKGRLRCLSRRMWWSK